LLFSERYLRGTFVENVKSPKSTYPTGGRGGLVRRKNRENQNVFSFFDPNSPKKKNAFFYFDPKIILPIQIDEAYRNLDRSKIDRDPKIGFPFCLQLARMSSYIKLTLSLAVTCMGCIDIS
jgi:hypothetical protein